MSDGSDDEQWEELIPDTPAQVSAGPSSSGIVTEIVIPATSRMSDAPLEIIIRRPPKPKDEKEAKKEKAEADALNRLIRMTAHQIHTIALLANTSIRNRWICDDLLQARLLSLTPLPLQTSFSMITKRNQPDRNLRGRQFETSLVRLADWWKENFRVEGQKGVRHMTFEEAALLYPAVSAKGKGKARDTGALPSDDVMNSEKSLMKHALMMRGSPDTSAQLFASLCRALSIPTRLVVNLQSVLWRKEKSEKDKALDKAQQKARKKKKDDDELREEARRELAMGRNASKVISANAKDTKASGPSTRMVEESDGDESMEEILPNGSTGAGSAEDTNKPKIRLRRSKVSHVPNRRQAALIFGGRKDQSPPVCWVEVFSKPDGRWMSVDPINAVVDKPKKFEPKSGDKHNHMLYVVAYEEDGYIKDVTPRYSSQYVTKILKERRTTGGQQNWWFEIVARRTRPFRLQRDDVEDVEFESLQLSEGIPSSVGAFKNHPIYALERHLNQDEVIHPKLQIGKFRGESIYPRANVVSVKSAENWMRSGRVVSEGEQPLKMGKMRPNTLNRVRAIELAKSENPEGEDGRDPTQGMYAMWQTELYIAPPVENGIVPKNDFGNIDLYVDTMLPEGGVHVPYKGTAKIARQLGIDYAEAVTGFEFRNRRAFPLISGVVIPADREVQLMEAYEISAAAEEEKERRKKEERIIKNWTKLIQGLQIKSRVRSQYHQGDDVPMASSSAAEDFMEDDGASQAGFVLDEEAAVPRKKIDLSSIRHLPMGVPELPPDPALERHKMLNPFAVPHSRDIGDEDDDMEEITFGRPSSGNISEIDIGHQPPVTLTPTPDNPKSLSVFVEEANGGEAGIRSHQQGKLPPIRLRSPQKKDGFQIKDDSPRKKRKRARQSSWADSDSEEDEQSSDGYKEVVKRKSSASATRRTTSNATQPQNVRRSARLKHEVD